MAQTLVESINKMKQTFNSLLHTVATPLISVDQQTTYMFWQIYNLQKYLTIVYLKIAQSLTINQYTSTGTVELNFEQYIGIIIQFQKVQRSYVWFKQNNNIGQIQVLEEAIDQNLNINTKKIREVLQKNGLDSLFKDSSTEQTQQFQYLVQFGDFLGILSNNLGQFNAKECAIVMQKILLRLGSILTILANKEYAQQFFYIIRKKQQKKDHNQIFGLMINFYRSTLFLHLEIIVRLIVDFQLFNGVSNRNTFLEQYYALTLSPYFRYDYRLIAQSFKQMKGMEVRQGDQLREFKVKIPDFQKGNFKPPEVQENNYIQKIQNSFIVKKLSSHHKKVLINFKQFLSYVQISAAQQNNLIKSLEDTIAKQDTQYKSSLETSLNLLRLGKVALPQRIQLSDNNQIVFGSKKIQIANNLQNIMNARIRCQSLGQVQYNSINYLAKSRDYIDFGEKIEVLFYQNLIGLEGQKKYKKQTVFIEDCYEEKYAPQVDKLEGSGETYDIRPSYKTILSAEMKILPLQEIQLQSILLKNWDQIMKQYRKQHYDLKSIVKIIVNNIISQYSTRRNIKLADVIRQSAFQDKLEKYLDRMKDQNQFVKIQNTDDLKKIIRQIMLLSIFTVDKQPVNVKQQVEKQKMKGKALTKQMRQLHKKKQQLFSLIQKMQTVTNATQQKVIKDRIKQDVEQVFTLPKAHKVQLQDAQKKLEEMKQIYGKVNEMIVQKQAQNQRLMRQKSDIISQMVDKQTQLRKLQENQVKYRERQILENEEIIKLNDFLIKFSQDPIFTAQQKVKVESALSSLLKTTKDPLDALKNIFHFVSQMGQHQVLTEKIKRFSFGNLQHYTPAQLQKDKLLSSAFVNKFITIFEDMGIFRELKIISSRYQSNKLLIKFYRNTGRYQQSAYIQNQNQVIEEWVGKVEKIYKDFLKQVIAGNKNKIEEGNILQMKNPKAYFMKVLSLPRANLNYTQTMNKLDALRFNLKNLVQSWEKKESSVILTDKQFVDELYAQIQKSLNKGAGFYDLLKDKMSANFTRYRQKQKLSQQLKTQKAYIKCLVNHFITTFTQMWKNSHIIQQLVQLVSKIPQKGTAIANDFWVKLQQMFHKTMLKQGFALVQCQTKSKYQQAKEILAQNIKGYEKNWGSKMDDEIRKCLDYIRKVEGLSQSQVISRMKSQKFDMN